MEEAIFRKGPVCVHPVSDGAKDVIVCFDLSQMVVAANPAADELLAGEDKSIVGRHLMTLDLPERVRSAVRDSVAATTAGDAVARKSFEVEGLSADRQSFLTRAEVLVVTGASEKGVVLVHLRDFAECLDTERKVLQLSKILRTMSEGNHAMVAASDEQELYATMCRIIVKFGGYALAWIGLAESDERRSVRPVAFAGIEDAARILWDEAPGGRGPAGLAIRVSAPQVCNDLIVDMTQEPWRAAALERNYRSILALPLKEKGAAFGVLLICAHAPNAFGLQELALLVELSENVAFGALSLRDHKARGELEAALLHAEKMEAIGELSGGVAHDFNNLLQVVASSLHVIKQRPDDVASRNLAIETIQVACKRASAITRDLLTLSRKEILAPESLEPSVEAFRWRELIGHSLGRDIDVELRIPPTTWPIYCDPGSLEIALINLAVNARDAMPRGGALILSARNTHANGAEFVEIDVADTGCGIDPAAMNHVFEPFYTTKPVGKGTGLGLSQVLRFARQSGGEARIASQPGDGATVTLRIPRGKARVAATAPDERAPS